MSENESWAIQTLREELQENQEWRDVYQGMGRGNVENAKLYANRVKEIAEAIKILESKTVEELNLEYAANSAGNYDGGVHEAGNPDNYPCGNEAENEGLVAALGLINDTIQTVYVAGINMLSILGKQEDIDAWKTLFEVVGKLVKPLMPAEDTDDDCPTCDESCPNVCNTNNDDEEYGEDYIPRETVTLVDNAPWEVTMIPDDESHKTGTVVGGDFNGKRVQRRNDGSYFVFEDKLNSKEDNVFQDVTEDPKAPNINIQNMEFEEAALYTTSDLDQLRAEAYMRGWKDGWHQRGFVPPNPDLNWSDKPFEGTKPISDSDGPVYADPAEGEFGEPGQEPVDIAIRTDRLWRLIFEKYRQLDLQHLMRRRREINMLFSNMVNHRQMHGDVGKIAEDVFRRTEEQIKGWDQDRLRQSELGSINISRPVKDDPQA